MTPATVGPMLGRLAAGEALSMPFVCSWLRFSAAWAEPFVRSVAAGPAAGGGGVVLSTLSTVAEKWRMLLIEEALTNKIPTLNRTSVCNKDIFGG